VGDAEVTGDAAAGPQLVELLEVFECWFPIVTP
jgi:hypothetical protein